MQRSPCLTCCHVSSLVIDTLYTRGQNIAVACFYFDFATGKAQTPASTLGALLKQVVGALDSIPRQITPPYGGQRKDIGGRRLQLPEILEMLETVSPHSVHSYASTLWTNAFQEANWGAQSWLSIHSGIPDRKATCPECGGKASFSRSRSGSEEINIIPRTFLGFDGREVGGRYYEEHS